MVDDPAVSGLLVQISAHSAPMTRSSPAPSAPADGPSPRAARPRGRCPECRIPCCKQEAQHRPPSLSDNDDEEK